MKKYILLAQGEVIEVNEADQKNEFGYTNLDFILQSPNYSNIEKVVLDEKPPIGSIVENGAVVQKKTEAFDLTKQIVQSRLQFFNVLFLDFLAENVALSLTKEQVRRLDIKLESVFKFLSKTGFETGLEDLQKVNTDETFTVERIQNLIQKLQNYLQNEANNYNFV